MKWFIICSIIAGIFFYGWGKVYEFGKAMALDTQKELINLTQEPGPIL